MPHIGYLIGLIVVLIVSNAFTLKRWLAADANCQASVNTEAAKAMGEDITAGNKGNRQAFEAGESSKDNVRTVFVPIERKIHETRYVSTCTGRMPDGMQDAVRAAVDAANDR